ncbi:hypothetical protein [Mesorhizobium atlanticum]|uniref:hypothetical protein n=1 Tax=Mesorhizobium atlanticum TaxID=2233532 RepID=UPI0015EBA61E|nr:hypothetical protein [Mesorhizobium atlanticum]
MMLFWGLSGKQYAAALDGYDLHFDRRWNIVERAVTYCATSPALGVPESFHVEDPNVLLELVIVTYELPEAL